MHAPIDGHSTPDGGDTGEFWALLVFQQAMDAKAPRPWILLLQVQDRFEKRERQLIVGMREGARPMVLEAFKALPLKGLKDRIDVRSGHLETACDAVFVPPFVPHADDGPPGLLGLGEGGKRRDGECELDGEVMTGEKAFDRMMIGRIAKFARDDADDCAVMNRRIELLDIQHIGSHSLRIDMAFPSSVLYALIHQPQHALDGEAPGFVPHDRPLDAGLATAFGNGFRQQHNRAHHCVIVLNIVHELELVLRKILCSRHVLPPSSRLSSRTTPPPARSRGDLQAYGVRTDRQKEAGQTIIYYRNRTYSRHQLRKTASVEQEEHGMATPARRPRAAPTPPQEAQTARKKAGRPQGPPSTIVNLRLPLELVARLDRYIDRLETQTGLKAHRGMIARQALELFLETHEAG